MLRRCRAIRPIVHQHTTLTTTLRHKTHLLSYEEREHPKLQCSDSSEIRRVLRYQVNVSTHEDDESSKDGIGDVRYINFELHHQPGAIMSGHNR